jgi:hypothetical protein
MRRERRRHRTPTEEGPTTWFDPTGHATAAEDGILRGISNEEVGAAERLAEVAVGESGVAHTFPAASTSS